MRIFYINSENKEVDIDYFTSDHHFGHANIIKYTERDFSNVDEMNLALIESWNSVVKPTDTVLNLGDAALGCHEETLKNFEKCNGNKLLIPGNHDAVSVLKSKSYRASKLHYYEKYFTVLPETPLKLTAVNHSGDRKDFYASHYPHDDLTDYQKKIRKNHLFAPSDVDLIHGHTHSPERIHISAEGVKSIHVGVDANNYKPVSAEEIVAILFE